MVITHRSRVDWWMWPVLVGPLGAAALSAHTLAARHQPVWIAAVALGGYVALLALVVWPMRYAIGPDGIAIRYGAVRTRIAWAELERIAYSASLLSSPALSLRRLELTYRGGKTIRISPVDRARFLADCAAASPAHRVDGDALRRR